MINGAQIQTKESFLYGRFETMVRPAFGSGIVSSFFLFNDKPGFQSKWCEIDWEFLGRNTNIVNTNFIRTLANFTDNNVNARQKTIDIRSSDVFWKLTIDWSGDKIIWYLNGEIIRTAVVSLNTPMKLMMNLWVSNKVNWAGEFNPGLLPQQAEYKYVKYTPYSGKGWLDDFTFIDSKRWQIADWELQGTTLVKENVSLSTNTSRSESNLILKLT